MVADTWIGLSRPIAVQQLRLATYRLAYLGILLRLFMFAFVKVDQPTGGWSYFLKLLTGLRCLYLLPFLRHVENSNIK